MKIIFTVASYYPVPGGVQLVTQYTAEEMVKQGHKVTILTSSYDRKDNITKHNGVDIIYTDLYKKADVILGHKNEYKQNILNMTKEYDVMINVSLQTPTTDLILPLLKKIHCKKVLYLHNIYDFSWKKNDFISIHAILRKCYYNISRRIFYSYAHKYIREYDLITHLSPFDTSIKYVKRHHINQNIILGNAAVDSIFNNRGIHSHLINHKYFICIANYNDNKNQVFVLQAFYKAILDKDIELIFIGKEANAYFQKLIGIKKKLDKQFGNRNVRFLAGISRTETEELLSGASALLLGSKIEMFPVVIIEAMASKVPFISTDVGCVRYQPGGFIAKNEDEMAYWMSFIVNNPDIASCYADAGCKYATANMTVKSRVSLLLDQINRIPSNVKQ